jgi:membrane associated rhomboid family serine protease
VIPLHDRNPTRRVPIVTLALIGTCFAVFLYELSLTMGSGGDAALERFFDTWGAVPSKITASIDAGNLLSQATLGILTSLFLHAGWLHLLGNMLYLWIFGNNVEDRLGRFPFLVFYLVGGVVAAITQVWIDPESSQPLVGASGAIAAALGAYLVLFPRARILSLVFLGFFYQLLEVPAVLILGFWFVLQLISGAASLGVETGQGGGVAFFAHIGGFALGLLVGAGLRAGGAVAASPSVGPMG